MAVITKNATLIYKVIGTYYEVEYSIGSGAYSTRINVSNGDNPPMLVNTTAIPPLTSLCTILFEGNSMTVRVADTSDTTGRYTSTYTASNGTITASEVNISTTIAKLP